MSTFALRGLSALVVAFGICAWPAIAADSKQEARAGAEVSATASGADFSILLGRWVRPDGGYTITVEGVDPNGKLDASYSNPNPLPFEQATASMSGDAIEVFLELRAGGYNGSTYNLTYDAATDVLRGVYYQAVAQQKFDIYFERSK
jgi:hypothetical protein